MKYADANSHCACAVRVVDANARYVLWIVRAAAKSDRSLARCGTELALTLCSDAREPQVAPIWQTGISHAFPHHKLPIHVVRCGTRQLNVCTHTYTYISHYFDCTACLPTGSSVQVAQQTKLYYTRTQHANVYQIPSTKCLYTLYVNICVFLFTTIIIFTLVNNYI